MRIRLPNFWRAGGALLLALAIWAGTPAALAATNPATSGTLTLSFRETAINEVYEMLSRQGRVNILLGTGVSGSVSVNLYEVSLDHAIRSIAEAAGFIAELRGDTWFVVQRDEAGKDSTAGATTIRSFKVQYTEPEVVSALLEKHLSRLGKVTLLPGRRLLVVEDRPEFLDRVDALLSQIDVQPRQVLIEARILEITLDGDQTYGIDWNVPFSLQGGGGQIGQGGLAPRGIAGLLVNIVTPEFELFLSALRNQGRVRTLSTPKLLVLENQQAEVVIGDRLGFRVTTTVNQVTTESIEFLESGVILKVTAAVDRDGRVLLNIHPEVSTGTINDGIPSLSTTEVTTQFLADDGQQIFIGGLIKNNDAQSRSGIPVLSSIPVLGGLFSTDTERSVNTETVVVITPHILDQHNRPVSEAVAEQVERQREDLQRKAAMLERSAPPSMLMRSESLDTFVSGFVPPTTGDR